MPTIRLKESARLEAFQLGTHAAPRWFLEAFSNKKELVYGPTGAIQNVIGMEYDAKLNRRVVVNIAERGDWCYLTQEGAIDFLEQSEFTKYWEEIK